mmetsp:Transcript_23692/g.42320  ORF Transcript_23692/g.42320 Transcript_23692/m.42320 type:complete len:239 (-) Transcript_23692:216-932(-)
MMLEPLEFHVGEQMRVLVVQVHHKAHINLIVLKVIDERSAARIAAQRPAHRVGHTAFAVLFRVNLPDFLHAQAVFLRLMTLGQAVFGDHFLGQRSAHALAQEHVFAMQLHARLGALTDGAVRLKAKDTGNDTFDFASVTVNQFRTRHAGENFNAQLFGLLRHPAAHIAHGDDVVAVIVHQRRHRRVRDADLTGLAQHIEVVVLDRHIQGRALVLPIGDQGIKAARVQNRTRQDMRADL